MDAVGRTGSRGCHGSDDHRGRLRRPLDACEHARRMDPPAGRLADGHHPPNVAGQSPDRDVRPSPLSLHASRPDRTRTRAGACRRLDHRDGPLPSSEFAPGFLGANELLAAGAADPARHRHRRPRRNGSPSIRCGNIRDDRRLLARRTTSVRGGHHRVART